VSLANSVMLCPDHHRAVHAKRLILTPVNAEQGANGELHIETREAGDA